MRLCAAENLPLHMGTRVGFVKFMRLWEPIWPSISKQSVTRSMEQQIWALRVNIKREILVIAAKTDTAFKTDFWTSSTTESFMMMGMHWIMQYWSLNTRILGTMHFLKKHTAANIFDSLLNARIDSAAWPRNAEGRIPESEEALRGVKLVHFGLKPALDRPVLTTDCGSDVSLGTKKDCLWYWNRCACHCLN